jgi:TetR/AcrR family transcriptional regulator
MPAVHRKRDRERSRGNIISAARAEFAAKGYAGARMEQIAQRAGINKELIYHYFRGKEQLFEEVRSQQLAEASKAFPPNPLLDNAPRPSELFAWRFQRMLGDREWIKLLTWEAAQDDEPPNARTRRATIQRSVSLIGAAQKGALVPAELDPRLLQLAVFALANYPLAFAQITRMTTGMAASDRRFQVAWTSFLRKLGARLLAPSAARVSRRSAAAWSSYDNERKVKKERGRRKPTVAGARS